MKTIIFVLFSLGLSSFAQAGVAKSGRVSCTIKSWDKNHYELNCDPRTPKLNLRTPASWVKKSLQKENPEKGKKFELVLSGENLRSWIDMNKKVLAKAETAPAAKGVKK